MKKYKFIIYFTFVIFVLCIIHFHPTKNENKILENNLKNSNLAIMLESDVDSKKYNQIDNFPTRDDGYYFDEKLSKCVEGNEISYNEETKEVTVKGINADKCYIYFSKGVNFSSYIQSLYTSSVSVGDGILYYHDNNLVDGANDLSYRYAGNNPNNYVCFGAGAENYYLDKGDCPDTNLYRIIGVFKNDSGQYEVKLIKSEYITSEELGINSNGIPNINQKYLRVKILPKNGFEWNNEEYVLWDITSSYGKYNLWEYGDQKATLNKALNSKYLNNLSNNWINMIINKNWYIRGCFINNATPNVTPKQLYDMEKDLSSNVAFDVPQNINTAKIGLMYASDYGFAAKNINNLWTRNLDNYNIDDNINNNWLFNGVDEWTITRNSNITISAFLIDETALMYNHYNFVNTNTLAVRPVFYLKSNILYASGDGSYEHPFIIK